MADERKVFAPTADDTIDEGSYEVILESAEPTTTVSGKKCLLVKYRIRSDVKQGFANRVVSERIWEDEDADWSGWFDHRKLHRLILTQPKPKLEFLNCDECVMYLNGLPMKIEIGIRDYTDSNGMERKANEVKRYSYAPSTVALQPKAEAKPVANVELPGDIDDADVPF